MNFKKWKLGLLVAFLSGILTGLVGLAADLTWRQMVILILVNVGKDGLLYLTQNPVSAVEFQTEMRSKTTPDGTTVSSTTRKTTVPTENTPP